MWLSFVVSSCGFSSWPLVRDVLTSSSSTRSLAKIISWCIVSSLERTQARRWQYKMMPRGPRDLPPSGVTPLVWSPAVTYIICISYPRRLVEERPGPTPRHIVLFFLSGVMALVLKVDYQVVVKWKTQSNAYATYCYYQYETRRNKNRSSFPCPTHCHTPDFISTLTFRFSESLTTFLRAIWRL